MKENRKLLDVIIGLAVIGCGITGIVSFFAAFFAFSGGFAFAGVYLIAAALSFGLLANAVLRQ
ncbi:MAG: hypothetical protein JXA89_09965 [Anaerolineae bacterium]|nr:hypothetical protein [Anaerolineae bacterium]